MKKAMDQSRLISILNGVSILALVLTALLLIIYGSTTDRLSMANEERFDLTYISQMRCALMRLPVTRNIMTTIGGKSMSWITAPKAWKPCRRSGSPPKNRT